MNSVLLAIGAFKPAGVTANAAAQFDDLHLQRGAGGTGCRPYFGGAWARGSGVRGQAGDS